MKHYENLPTHTETPRNTTHKIANLYIEFNYHFLTLQKKSHYFWTGVFIKKACTNEVLRDMCLWMQECVTLRHFKNIESIVRNNIMVIWGLIIVTQEITTRPQQSRWAIILNRLYGTEHAIELHMAKPYQPDTSRICTLPQQVWKYLESTMETLVFDI